MQREFNVTGLCVPEYHYMVDLTSRILKIKAMVDKGNYFTINRARQYGKTTVLTALTRYWQKEYHVVYLDFQVLGYASFETETVFCHTFADLFAHSFSEQNANLTSQQATILQQLVEKSKDQDASFHLYELFRNLIALCACSDKPIVLIIDEADSATNNQVFLDFLAQLRNYYLQRLSMGTKTFQSVILAGVYNVKNLKLKIRSEDDHKTNSPWNIAVDFKIDLSFSVSEIAEMLQTYETDVQSGMNVYHMAELLYEDTAGYPFLVSRLCKIIDEIISGSREFPDKKTAWTKSGYLAAVRFLLKEENFSYYIYVLLLMVQEIIILKHRQEICSGQMLLLIIWENNILLN